MFAMLKTMIAGALSAVKQQQVDEVAKKMEALDKMKLNPIEDNFDDAIEETKKRAARMAARGTPKMDSPSRFRPTKGDFMANNLLELKSTRSVNAIAGLGVWIALAKGFAAWTTPKNARNAEQRHSRICDAFEEFHAWNVMHVCEEQYIMGSPVMVDGKWNMERCEETLIKLSYTQPMASTGPAKEALLILARVRGQSIEELLNARKKAAEEATVAKMEQITGFLTELWNFSSNDNSVNPKMDLDKVLNKVEQTLQWVASWNTTTEQGQLTQISELILLEEDLKYIRTLRPAGDDGARFVDKILPTTDSMMYREDWDFREGTTSSRGDGRSRPTAVDTNDEMFSIKERVRIIKKA